MLHEIDTVLFDFDGTLVEVDIDFAQMRRGVVSLGLEYGVSSESDLYVLEYLEDIFRKLLPRDADQARSFKQRAKKLIVDIEMEATTRSAAMPDADKLPAAPSAVLPRTRTRAAASRAAAPESEPLAKTCTSALAFRSAAAEMLASP